MTTEIETLRAAITDLRIERDALSSANQALKANKLDYQLLSDDYRALAASNEALRTRNSQLLSEREVFRTAIRELRAELDEVRDTNQQVNSSLSYFYPSDEVTR
jgi:FtsZ-binding cell division protein ZapB